MVKSYVRWQQAGAFGVLSSGPVAHVSATTVASAALETVALLSLRQGAALARALTPAAASGPDTAASSSPPPEVTSLATVPGEAAAARLAAGYSDGSIRLWRLSTGEAEVTLHGHKGAVTALRFNRSGSLLASGGADTDATVWDVAAECGLFRLRGHRAPVTDVAWLDARGGGGGEASAGAGALGGRLLTSSKDGTVRVWQLATQHCSQTVAAAGCGEVWSIDADAAGRRIALAGADSLLRLYAVTDADGDGDGGDDGGGGTVPRTAPPRPALEPLGAPLQRPGGDRCAAGGLRFSPCGAYLALLPAGRLVELWRVLGPDEAARRARRRRKRRREKSAHHRPAAGAGGDGGAAAADGDGGDGDDAAAAPQAGDELALACTLPLRHKAVALSWAPPGGGGGGGGGRGGGGRAATPAAAHPPAFAVALSCNAVESFALVPSSDPAAAAVGGVEPAPAGEVSRAGHRSDVRALALAPDDSLLLTVGHAGAKIWNPTTGACLRTVTCGYGLCCAFAPGGRFAVVGTKSGALEFVDVASASLARTLPAHAGPVWSLSLRPDGLGLATGGGDKEVRLWEWCVAPPQPQPGAAAGDADADADADAAAAAPPPTPPAKTLSASLARTLKLPDDVLCVRHTPDGKLLAAALLDCTVRVFFTDTLALFLSLYGHKLPVLALAISSDGTLLASGGADKNVKVWGLDFGDCHRSLRAHGDSVTALAFVPRTHYLFSASRDKTVKYWDADSFDHLLTLPGHAAEVWALALSPAGGDALYSAGADRGVRRWGRTQEPFFVDEERERRLESLFEEGAEEGGGEQRERQKDGGDDAANAAGAVGVAGRRSSAALTAADGLADALEAAREEAGRRAEHRRDARKAAESGSKPPPFAPNPLLQGRSPSSHVLAALSAVRRPDLEQALLLLPYPSAAALLSSLPGLLAPGDGARAELAAAAAVLLLRLHSAALGAAPATRPALLRLRALLRARLGEAAGECRLIVAGGEAVARMVAGAGGGGGGAAGDDEA